MQTNPLETVEIKGIDQIKKGVMLSKAPAEVVFLQTQWSQRKVETLQLLTCLILMSKLSAQKRQGVRAQLRNKIAKLIAIVASHANSKYATIKN